MSTRTQALEGIRFIRSYVSIVREDPVTKNVILRYSTPDEGVKEEEFDMVVPGRRPGAAQELS